MYCVIKLQYNSTQVKYFQGINNNQVRVSGGKAIERQGLFRSEEFYKKESAQGNKYDAVSQFKAA